MCSNFFFINNFIYFVFLFILLENTKEEEGEKLLHVIFFSLFMEKLRYWNHLKKGFEMRFT